MVYTLLVDHDYSPFVGRPRVIEYNATMEEHTRKLFHGTNVEQAQAFLAGQELDGERALQAKINGQSGFFLATDYYDAEYFALRRGRGAVVEYHLSLNAVRELRKAGIMPQPIPAGGMYFHGQEVRVPLDGFPLFNRLRSGGEITVHVAEEPKE